MIDMKRFTIIFAALVMALEASALSFSAMPWMRNNRSVVDMSLAGSASLSQENMAWAAFGNTASVPFSSQKVAADVSYSFVPSSRMHTTAVGTSWNVNPKWGVSAGVSYGFGPSYQVMDGFGKPQGTYIPGYLQVNAGFGSKFHELVTGGLSLYYARQDVASGVSSWTAGLNGFLNVHWSDFTIGAGIINFGLPVTNASGDTYGTPTSVKLDFMYDKALAAKWRIQLNAGLDAFVPECGAGLTQPSYLGHFFGKVLGQGIAYRLSGQVGAQASYNDWLFFRAGYHYAPDILRIPENESGGMGVPVYVPAHASVGLGLKLHRFTINAAYLFASRSINNTFALSLGFTF